VAIRPFVCEKKRFAQKFTDRRTDDGRRAIALAHSWNELIKLLSSVLQESLNRPTFKNRKVYRFKSSLNAASLFDN